MYLVAATYMRLKKGVLVPTPSPWSTCNHGSISFGLVSYELIG